MSTPLWTRREALALGAGAFFGLPAVRLDGGPLGSGSRGRVEGWPEAAAAGEIVLADGGNAVDAIVTAALVASIVAPQMCGPGGYGGHCIVAVNGGRELAAIDFNTAAPAALREDSFPVDESGQVKGNVNSVGWIAAGVPGTLAGMQLLLDRFGTLSFSRAVEPAIRYARGGFRVGTSLANSLRATRSQLQKDQASAQLLLPDGELPRVGASLRNPDLAAMLQKLAEHGSVESFYIRTLPDQASGRCTTCVRLSCSATAGPRSRSAAEEDGRFRTSLLRFWRGTSGSVNRWQTPWQPRGCIRKATCRSNWNRHGRTEMRRDWRHSDTRSGGRAALR